MAINASIDSVTYEGITKILTGGKTINLSYHDDGGGGSDLPAEIAEIKAGSWTQESDSLSDLTFNHGCADTPDIIIVQSDFKTRYTASSKPSNSTIVSEYYNGTMGFKSYATVSTTYTGESNPDNSPVAAQTSSTNDGFITTVDATSVTINAASNRRIGGGLTYTWFAIRLA